MGYLFGIWTAGDLFDNGSAGYLTGTNVTYLSGERVDRISVRQQERA
jgi:hypothetical protein